MKFLIILQDFTPASSDDILRPILEYGVIGTFVIVFAYVIYKLYVTNKNDMACLNDIHRKEIEAMTKARVEERRYLFEKLEQARIDATNEVKGANQQVIDIANKFRELANDLRSHYAQKP
ncbi:MAG: hypothetical protein WA775_03070 [Psychroserpens sp.]|uniref:hypothetical protein n=1 Tax=Psychroserpens sp. TaxID=2020870 RepID=UPI003CC328AB